MTTELVAATSANAEVDTLLLTEEQSYLATTIRELLAERSPETRVRDVMDSSEGIDRPLWRTMAQELGVAGLSVPEEFGGGGASFVEVAVLCEELGRSLAAVPLLSTAVLAQTLLLDSADEQAQARWLPDLCSGASIAGVALTEPDGAWHAADSTTQAVLSGGRWTLSGRKTYVVDGAAADVVFVVARTGDGLATFAVPGDAPGLTRTALPTMDQTRRLADLTFDSVPAELVGEPGAQERVAKLVDVAAVALAAESVGGADRVLEMAVEYAKVRVQFGRPIGSFQAIKHKCADMLLQVETARSAVAYARKCVEADERDRALAASTAKSRACDAFAFCAAENIQVHGGIGFTWEHPAHLYFKRARSSSVLFGDSYQHRERIGDLLNL
ncbi:acyl-CoA dehydrogenase family protein [Sporichthya brevicatena]|uniref:Acyl-CoA dehydrogenase family protein n=1 Tax=Sporichthya brevicatena TaxID=171442 RepID=A0ABN1H4I8_9ACTN